MIFDKNQTSFKDVLQQAVWTKATRLLPLEVTLPHAGELAGICEDYHNFLTNLLSCIYTNPERYGLVANPSKSVHGNGGSVNACDCSEWRGSELVGNDRVLPTDHFNHLVKKYYTPAILEAARKYHGFVFENNGVVTRVSNEIFPEYFTIRHILYQAGCTHYKLNREYFEAYCDFRILTGYKRTYKDLHDILSDSRRQIAQEIHEYAVQHNIKPQRCMYYFRVEYKHKGKRVFQADIGQANQLLIDPVVDIRDQEIFGEGADPEFKAFILKHITNRCTGCSPNCRKRYEPKMIFGKKMIVCVLKITDPTVDELPHLYKLLKIAKEKTTNDL